MPDDKYAQFLLEKELAEKLKYTSRDERKTAYKKLYGELFNKFPGIAYNPKADISHKIQWQIKFLQPFLNKEVVFIEIGAGNCLLSVEVANSVKKVIAYEVADAIPHIENKPGNVILKIFDGLDLSELKDSADIIYSNQVFEHLHPEDVYHHLHQYHNILRENGKIVIVTPNSLTGPYDISRNYSLTPVGFHLKEYTNSEIKTLLLNAGFTNPKFFIGSKRIGYFPVNIHCLLILETLYKKVSNNIRYKLKNISALKNLFGIKVTAVK